MEPDYELDAVMELTQPEQFKALGDEVRQKLLALLMERATTTMQLAEALGSPTSTIAHHLHVLTQAGLTKVVRTRQIRAITERYYGRTARTYISMSSSPEERQMGGVELLRQILATIHSAPQEIRYLGTTVSYARMSEERAEEFSKRVQQLAAEFDAMSEPREEMYGLLVALYRTDIPQLPVAGQE
ncbi:MAG TPA: transcriptional regulator [Ktedonobacter sp.]|nr:transcriptional regulator [Ktedonobacter sp.]